MPHEILESFDDEGLPLCKTLVEMLDEHFSHCTERRGCGFTQSTRYLSDLINQPRDALSARDLKVFSNWPLNSTEDLAQELVEAGWPSGWRNLHDAPADIVESVLQSELLERLKVLVPKVKKISEGLEREESALFMSMLQDLFTGSGRRAPEVKGMPVKPDIGSCSQAEEFFLEIANERIRRGGSVNIIVATDGVPVMVEKMNLGESHSAIVVAPIRINGVWVPPGGLCALEYSESIPVLAKTRYGAMISLSEVSEARLLRLTTLSVSPKVRKRAFSEQVEAQIRAQMLSPLTTTIDQLHDFALNQIASAD